MKFNFIKRTFLVFLGILVSIDFINHQIANADDLESFGASGVKPIKVALLGDTDAGVNFGSVLALTAAEKSDVVMINGDFGYSSTPAAWKARVVSAIDYNTHPIIGALGNHDRLSNNMGTYISIFDSFRTPKNGLKSACTGLPTLSLNQDTTIIDESCTFGNVTLIANAIGQTYTKPYLESRLESKLISAPANNWKLVGYHYSIPTMNPGLKSSEENSYAFFDLIRKYGAMGAQAHTHSVMASCPIASPFVKGGSVKCHRGFGPDLEDRFVMPGVGLFFDSSLGGKEVRPRSKCKTASDPTCQHMVDLITKEGYTRIDGRVMKKFNPMGALFIVFNAGGDPSKAFAYYKSIDGQVIFQFTVSR
jgi:hypothetical protein